jgi:GTP-binding protein HflX
VVADTVGFIRELPHELVAAFQSTLTEAREATLLLHVVDASDPRRDERIEQVNKVLAEVGAGDLPQILVFNKTDRLQLPPALERDDAGQAQRVWISAARGDGLELLVQAAAERLSRFAQRARIRMSAASGALRASLYASAVVTAESSSEDGSIELEINVPDAELQRLARLKGVEILPSASANPA